MYGALRVLTPPASEPVTLDQAKRHCRIDNDYDDDLVALYLTSARMWAETYLNRALITQQLQYNITWAPPPTATPLVPQSLIVFPLNWPPLVKRPIELPRAPTVSVEGITWGAIDDMQAADPDDYDTNLLVEPGYIAVKPQLLPRIPQQSMSINYTSGYSDADPTLIPAPILHGILLLTAYLYEQRGDAGGEMPPAARNLMQPYRLWTFAG
jgi:Phage gp6-like head-tail connector protein